MEPGKAPTSRFGDNAVWLMVGLAGRLARLLDLERLATSPFSGDLASITDEDMARMRTWLNLTSNDHLCAFFFPFNSFRLRKLMMSLSLFHQHLARHQLSCFFGCYCWRGMRSDVCKSLQSTV